MYEVRSTSAIILSLPGVPFQTQSSQTQSEFLHSSDRYEIEVRAGRLSNSKLRRDSREIGSMADRQTTGVLALTSARAVHLAVPVRIVQNHLLFFPRRTHVVADHHRHTSVQSPCGGVLQNSRFRAKAKLTRSGNYRVLAQCCVMVDVCRYLWACM